MSDERQNIDLDLALVDPSAVFRTPEDVVACESISPEQRAEILLRWDYDARELEVAEEEGMRDGAGPRLERIAQSLERLGYAVERDTPPPTKQGGVAAGGVHRKSPLPGREE